MEKLTESISRMICRTPNGVLQNIRIFENEKTQDVIIALGDVGGISISSTEVVRPCLTSVVEGFRKKMNTEVLHPLKDVEICIYSTTDIYKWLHLHPGSEDIGLDSIRVEDIVASQLITPMGVEVVYDLRYLTIKDVDEKNLNHRHLKELKSVLNQHLLSTT